MPGVLELCPFHAVQVLNILFLLSIRGLLRTGFTRSALCCSGWGLIRSRV